MKYKNAVDSTRYLCFTPYLWMPRSSFFWRGSGVLGGISMLWYAYYRASQQRIFLPEGGYSMRQTPTVVFDIDDTLIKRKLSLSKIKKFYTIFNEAGEDKPALRTVVWWAARHYHRLIEYEKKFDDEKTIHFIGQHHPVLYKKTKNGTTFVEEFHEIISKDFSVLNDSLSIVEELRSNGYPVALATNHSIKTFNNISQKEPKNFSPSQFVTVFTSDTITAPKAELGLIKKPQLYYFYALHNDVQRYYATLTQSREESVIIVIDDNKANVRAAASAGNIGVRFFSAPQLRKDLGRLGIKIDQYVKQ